jgi:hypothetical protein
VEVVKDHQEVEILHQHHHKETVLQTLVEVVVEQDSHHQLGWLEPVDLEL